jgi:D-cysteine desulfhydrase family pyridoxal phosphate-dependent enzyme
VVDETDFLPPFPRFTLTALPSPLERASRLEEALRSEGARPPRMYIKRDDLLTLAMGGNKVRNLEFSIGAALDTGATDVITAGRAQSNHCRLTAAACARAQLRAHLVMSGSRPPRSQGNLLLSELFGARVQFTDTSDRGARDEAVRRVADEITKAGGQPYTLPVGGSDARGAVGHALAALEIAQQCEALGERIDRIVLATATGGTQAGMLSGLHKLGMHARVTGFTVRGSAVETAGIVRTLAEEVAAAIGAGSIDPALVDVDDSELGGGYGVPSIEGDAAIAMLAQTQGLLADPVYTAKALAGLLSMIRRGSLPEDSTVVFVHTGGAPALFADLLASNV